MTITIVSIQTSVDVAFQIVRQLPNGFFGRGFGYAKLLFEVCVLGAHFLDLVLGCLDLSVAFIDFAQRDVNQILQARDRGHCLFDQVELLRLQVVSPTLCLLADDLVVLLADADHILLVLPQSLPDVVAFFGRDSLRGGCLAFIRAGSRAHARSHYIFVWRQSSTSSSLLSATRRPSVMLLVLDARASLLFSRPLRLATSRHALHRRCMLLSCSTNECVST